MTTIDVGHETDHDHPPIPLITPTFGDEEVQAVTDVLRSGWVAQGPRVAAFEQSFAERVGAPHAVAVSSCTTALHLALAVLDMGADDEVIVPSLSFIATTNVVTYVGATPVYADVDAITGNLTAETIANAVTERTRAVIVVHQAGVPADLDAIGEFCGPLGINIVEDAACAVGSTFGGRPIGGHGNLSTFSFHPRKLLTTGEGGMLVVTDAAQAQRARRLREHGMSVSAADRHAGGGIVFEQYLETGFNYRMTDLQAAIGLVQLGKLDNIVLRRREIAAGYHERLGGIDAIRCVTDPPGGTTNYQSFWIVLGTGSRVSRNELLENLTAVGIACRRGIMAAHLEPAGSRWAATNPLGPTRLIDDVGSDGLDVTEWLSGSSLILPVFHDMTDHDIDRVCRVILDCVA